MSLELQSLLPCPNNCLGESPHQQGRDTKMLSFCGIDVSKDRLDVMVLPEEQCCSVPNNAGGKSEVAVPSGVTVFELFAPGRRRTTVLAWIVSFAFLWASNGILFMLPTILTERGIPLTQAISFHL